MGRLSRTIDLFFFNWTLDFFLHELFTFFLLLTVSHIRDLWQKYVIWNYCENWYKIGCGLNILTLLKFWISSLYIIWIGFAAFVNALCQDVCKVSTPMTPFMFVICYSFIPFRDGTRVPIKGGLNY